jgi:GNAT superfamily N-acetyltransferase
MTDRGGGPSTGEPETFPVRLDGYTDLPPGKIANVVTFLERTEPPPASPPTHAVFAVRHVANPTVAWFRALYSRIGQDWLWFSATVMPDERLAAYISQPTVEILALTKDGEDTGLAEIDFSKEGEAEIVTFGVIGEATGTGAARHLMGHTLASAFRPDIGRLWLHTCTFDHPAAVRFYLRSGFRAWKFAIEISDDPRLTGALPASAAPHVPLIRPREESALP